VDQENRPYAQAMDQVLNEKLPKHLINCSTAGYNDTINILFVYVKLGSVCLPSQLKKLESFKVFKAKLKPFLLDHPFHSMNEFLVLMKVDVISR
jgi:hypothetical protein